ncbi:MAG TPA: beta-ketoacyl synthase N-terminal-like domain-containing protein, partial [Burkholderiaceae bacterium]|nr:beta-ketoacyl synthase N-terminal-like domain-containing protein [Burkholderiaceae bacterium]
IFITGTGVICGSGRTPDEVLEALRAGRTSIRPIEQWDAANWTVKLAAEVGDYNPGQLTGDRKLLKFIRRTDVFGLYAADRAIESSGFSDWRATLDAAAAERCADATGVFVGSGGGNFGNQYDYLPLIAAAAGQLEAFGAELSATVNPMWLLRSLPNNVLGHVGIRHGLKGPNACITNHSISGPLALAEAAESLRNGECTRAVVAAHDAGIEPQTLLYYDQMGLLSNEALRPFDARHDGSVMGEGAAAIVLESGAAAQERGAKVLGEFLGAGSGSDGLGLLPISEVGDGLVRAITAALQAAQLEPADVGMIVAHGNGTANSDVSETRALLQLFGRDMPPVTSFKWSFGHLLAASGLADATIGLAALRARVVPGIAPLAELDPDCAALNASNTHREPRSDVALLLSRGFGGTNAACLLRAPAS